MKEGSCKLYTEVIKSQIFVNLNSFHSFTADIVSVLFFISFHLICFICLFREVPLGR